MRHTGVASVQSASDTKPMYTHQWRLLSNTATLTPAQFPAVISLSGINGLNGFKFNAEQNNDWNARSISAGDVNGDGQPDLIIGADNYHGNGDSVYSGRGRSYVVFGGKGMTGNGVFNLSSLNGDNGFKLEGETANDASGCSVTVAGDINGDGHNDLLIGAYGYGSGIGRSYVVFGGPGIGSSGLILLSSLNGANGFKLDGENSGDSSGVSVDVAGDINGDGHADLIIAAPGYPKYGRQGRSYVLFGGLGVGSGGVIALSSLNGSNGFKLDGENFNDMSDDSFSGFISAAGDINGDGYSDLIIGASGYPKGDDKGRSYVLFGGPGVGGSGGVIALSSLNGSNGFKLDGENNNDRSGYSVSGAGDINGDGHDDLIVGAPYYGKYNGRSYVVFGGPGVGSGGIIALSSLNGSNGFKLDGENNVDSSGGVVSAAGDINGDGYDDLLIGAAYANANGNGKGRSYVVFGRPGVGSGGVIALSSLNGANGFKLDGELNGDRSGIFVNAAGDVNGDGHADLLIGADAYPPYGGNGWGRTYLIYGDSAISPPSVNRLVINQNQTLMLTNQNLNITDANHTASSLFYVISNLQHGRFSLVMTSNQAITQFSQVQVVANQVQFSADDSSIAPSYTVQVQGQTFAISSPQNASVTFYRQPGWLSNHLSINQGQTVLMTLLFLNVTDDYPENQVNFMISNLLHGQFISLPQNTSLLQFTEAQLAGGQINFKHDNSSNPPSYSVSVSDPYFILPPAATGITFYRVPVWNNNRLVVKQGQSVEITTDFLSVTDDYPPSQIIFSASEIQHGNFILSPSDNSITQFSEQQLASSQIRFVHDGSVNSPSYQIGVSDGYFTLPASSAEIDFSKNEIIPGISPGLSTNIIIAGSVIGAALFLLACYCKCRRKNSQPSDPVRNLQTRESDPVYRPLIGSDAQYISLSQPVRSSSRMIRSQNQSLGNKQSGNVSQGQPSSGISSISSRLMNEAGEMKISFSIAYQDLEFDEKDKLGSGAYGTVYKGAYKFNQVAIKKLHAEHLSEDAVAELKQEAGILGSMRSDYIVRLNGVCLEPPHFCLVMELMPKGSLYGLLQNSPDLPLSVRYQIGIDIGYGLYHLHEMHILHRDLKSLNVLLDDRLRAKITDFGLSKMKSEMSSMSSTKGMKGTLGWMGPELFTEKPEVTSAVDIYAYGMVLWELMIKPYRIPFQGLVPASLITAKLTRGDKQEIIPPDCPPKMAQLIRACWQEPQRRPPAKVLAKSLSALFKASQEQSPKISVESHQKNKVVQKDDLLTAAAASPAPQPTINF